MFNISSTSHCIFFLRVSYPSPELAQCCFCELVIRLLFHFDSIWKNILFQILWNSELRIRAKSSWLFSTAYTYIWIIGIIIPNNPTFMTLPMIISYLATLCYRYSLKRVRFVKKEKQLAWGDLHCKVMHCTPSLLLCEFWHYITIATVSFSWSTALHYYCMSKGMPYHNLYFEKSIINFKKSITTFVNKVLANA